MKLNTQDREKKQFTTITVAEGFTEIMYWSFAT